MKSCASPQSFHFRHMPVIHRVGDHSPSPIPSLHNRQPSPYHHLPPSVKSPQQQTHPSPPLPPQPIYATSPQPRLATINPRSALPNFPSHAFIASASPNPSSTTFASPINSSTPMNLSPAAIAGTSLLKPPTEVSTVHAYSSPTAAMRLQQQQKQQQQQSQQTPTSVRILPQPTATSTPNGGNFILNHNGNINNGVSTLSLSATNSVGSPLLNNHHPGAQSSGPQITSHNDAVRLELTPIKPQQLNNNYHNSNNNNINGSHRISNNNSIGNGYNLNGNSNNNNNNNNNNAAATPGDPQRLSTFHPPQKTPQQVPLQLQSQQQLHNQLHPVRRSPLQNGVIASLQGIQQQHQQQVEQQQSSGGSLGVVASSSTTLRPITPQQQHHQPLHAGTPPRSNSQQGRQSQQSLDSIGKLSSRGSSSPSSNPYMAKLESAIGQLHLSKSNSASSNGSSAPNIVHNNLKNGSSMQVSNNDLQQQHFRLQQPQQQDLSHMRGSEV